METQAKKRIRTDIFSNKLKEAFPQFANLDNTQIFNYLNTSFPGLSEQVDFYDPQPEPDLDEAFTAPFEEQWARKKVTGHNVLGTFKELRRIDQDDVDNALAYKEWADKGDRSRGFQGDPFKGLTRQQVRNMELPEIEEWYTAELDNVEELRKQDAKNHEILTIEAEEKIRNNPKIQAVKQWYEENPVEGFTDWWTDPTNLAYGIGQFGSSYAPIVASGVAGGLVGGTPGAAIGAGSMGYVLESGNHFSTAYQVARDELGMGEEEAYALAAESAHNYGLISALLESVAPTMAVKSMLLPKSLTRRFVNGMMNHSNKKVASFGRKLSKKEYADVTKKANAEFTAGFGKIKKMVSGDSRVRAGMYEVFASIPRYAVNRFTKKKITEAGLEGLTEGSQYLAEEAMLEGFVKNPDRDNPFQDAMNLASSSSWLSEKMSNQEFKDAVAMGTFALLSPVGGGGMRGTGLTDSQTLSDGKTISVDEDNNVVITSNPIENGSWQEIEKEDGDKKVDTKEEVYEDPLVTKIKSYVGNVDDKPQAKPDGTKIENLGSALLDDIKENGALAVGAIEHHTVSDTERSDLLQLAGHALVEADEQGIFNIRMNENGSLNENDVLMTLRGIARHNIQIRETEVSGELGSVETKQTISLQGNQQQKKAIEEQFKNPAKSFGALNMSKLMAEQDRKIQQEKEKQGGPVNAGNNNVQKNQRRGNSRQRQNNVRPKDNNQLNQDNEKNKDLSTKKWIQKYTLRYKELESEGREEEAKAAILKLNKDKFREFVEQTGQNDNPKFDRNKDGSVTATKKNKEIAWDTFSKRMESLNESEFKLGDTGNDQERNNNLNNANRNSLDDTEEPPKEQDGEGVKTNTGTKFHDGQFSQVALQEEEEVQPFAFEDGVPRPETVEMTERLSTQFPEIEAEVLQKVVDNEGSEVAGKAFSNIVQWSEDSARIDDIPHEYFHIYLDAFEKSPIIKAGLKKFTEGAATIQEAKEQFTELVGNYYANRITDKSLSKKLKVWIRQAWLHFKKRFGKLNKQDYVDLVGEQFFKGVRPSSKPLVTSKAVYYSQTDEKNANDIAHDDDNKEQEVVQGSNLREPGFALNNIFQAALGTYLPKKYLAVDVMGFAKQFDNYDDFKAKIMDDVVNTFNGNVSNQDTLEEFLRTLWLQKRSQRNIAILGMNKEKKKTEYDANDVEAIDVNDGRFRLELIFKQKRGQKKPILDRIQPQFDINHARRGRKTTQIFTENFLELQNKLRGDKVRFQYLPLDNIYKSVTTKEGEHYWFSMKDGGFQLNPGAIREIDLSFFENYINNPSSLQFFFSTKGGDNAQMIVGVVPPSWTGSQQKKHHGKPVDVTKIDRDFFEKELKAQVDSNFITPSQAEQMTKDADELAKQNTRIKKKGKLVPIGNLAYATTLGYHIRWQQIKGNNYMYRNPRFIDIVNRLRIDLSEGITPYGAGDRRMLWMNTNDIEIKGPDQDGNQVSWDRERPFGDTDNQDGEDGVLYTGGQYLNKIGSAFGMKETSSIKTSIRHIDGSNNPHNYPDYIGVKMQEMTPMAGMKIYKKGDSSPFIEVIGQGKNTRFKVLKGHQIGMEFDSFGTNNEIKDAAGSLAETGVVHVLPESSTKVMIKDKTANNSSHPVTVHEMLMDSSLLDPDFQEGREYLSALDEYIKENVVSRMEMLQEFRNNPKALRNYLWKGLRTGELPSELQQYLRLDKTGSVLTIPTVMSLVVSMLNNRFVTGGMMRMRTSEGRGTKLTLKPAGNLNIKPNNVIVSAQNRTMVDLVEKKYAESLGRNRDYNFNWTSNHEKISTLNEFLESNKYLTLLHRQPVQGGTKYVPRRIQRFHEGSHGNTIFMSKEDVFVLHEADFDGDAVYMERPKNQRLTDALESLSETEWFQKRNKIVGLQMFKTTSGDISIASRKDRSNFFWSNANAMGAEGKTVNAKVASSTMAFKELKFTDTWLPKGVYFEVNNPQDTVVLDYIDLDVQELLDNPDTFRLITEVNNDKIVMRKKDAGLKVEEGESQWLEVEAKALPNLLKEGYSVYLQTTFENEMSTLLQMSVDNVKNGLLNQIGFNDAFLMKRIFKRSDGKEIGNAHAKKLQNVASAFKYSSTRRGRNSQQNKMKMTEMFEEFENIRNRYFEKGTRTFQSKENVVNSIRGEINKPDFSKKPWGVVKIGLEHQNITPMERLLMEPDFFMDTLSQEDRVNLGQTILHRQEGQYLSAHVNTMNFTLKPLLTRTLQKWVNTGKAEQGVEALKFAKEMAKDFYKILDKRNEQNPHRDTDQMQGIAYDTSEDFVDFVDKWMPEFNKLNEMQKIVATMKFLTGSEHYNLKGKRSKKGFVLKLLPIELMHGGLIKRYAQAFNQNLKTGESITRKEGAKTRYGYSMVKNFKKAMNQKMCVNFNG